MQLSDEEHIQKRAEWWEGAVDKEFAKIHENFVSRGLYARTVLEPKVRQLCAISGLTVLNALPQLKVHIMVAFRVGATEAEVKEAIVQMVTYCGMPYVVQAFEVYKEVVQEYSDIESDRGK